MISDAGEPSVVEFNTRFGDPETQVTLLRLESDLAMLLLAAADGKLGEYGEPVWAQNHAIYVVGAAAGYPENPKRGDTITGIEAVDSKCKVFMAGVAAEAGKLVTAGGRVLGVGALGSDPAEARITAYQNMERIQWEGLHYRRDIGQ